jgi:two-component system response regulator YesN
MLKVFLVEDEFVVRQGIKQIIDWQGNGFEFVGEAGDGELAYPMIQESVPDILITDIKMPFMDGLELSRLVLEKLPDIKIIILSGYDEFEYAKEAISIGITDYLLKPITGTKLLEAVKKVGEKIESEQKKRQFIERYELEQAENAKRDKRTFFQKLVTEKQTVSQILESARNCGIELLANSYEIILLQLYPEDEYNIFSEELNSASQSMEDELEKLKYAMTIDRGVDGWGIILMDQVGGKMEWYEADLEERIKESLSPYHNITYFGGIGSRISRLSEFPISFREANRALAYRYFGGKNQIHRSGENYTSVSTSVENENIDLGELSSKHIDRKIVDNFLKSGLKGEISGFIERYVDELGEKSVGSLLFRQYMTMDMYMAAVSMLEQIGCQSSELAKRCGDYEAMVNAFDDIEEIKSYLKRVFEIAIDMRDEVSHKKYVKVLGEAVQFIYDNYDNENISLNAVAANANISPNHFSTIFSQEMNQTFIDFLTSVRMEKAKELLRSTNMRTSEIANAVGYKDPHYFSYLFKKTQDCTPREYKAKG